MNSQFPMIKYALGKGLSAGCFAECTREAHRLLNRHVCPDDEHRRSRPLLLANDMPTTLAQAVIYTADSIFGALYIHCQKLTS